MKQTKDTIRRPESNKPNPNTLKNLAIAASKNGLKYRVLTYFAKDIADPDAEIRMSSIGTWEKAINWAKKHELIYTHELMHYLSFKGMWLWLAVRDQWFPKANWFQYDPYVTNELLPEMLHALDLPVRLQEFYIVRYTLGLPINMVRTDTSLYAVRILHLLQSNPTPELLLKQVKADAQFFNQLITKIKQYHDQH